MLHHRALLLTAPGLTVWDVRWLQVEAAAHVVLSGVTSTPPTLAAKVNGRFAQVERDVHRKVGNPDTWLFVAKDGHWYVGWYAIINNSNRKKHFAIIAETSGSQKFRYSMRHLLRHPSQKPKAH